MALSLMVHTAEQKAMLGRCCGLTTKQVSDWFTNTRMRKLRKHVREMAEARGRALIVFQCLWGGSHTVAHVYLLLRCGNADDKHPVFVSFAGDPLRERSSCQEAAEHESRVWPRHDGGRGAGGVVVSSSFA